MRNMFKAHILLMTTCAVLLGAAASASAQQDARWNALYDRIIRLEHQLRTMRGAPSSGGGASDARLRALEAEVNDLRRQVGARLKRMDARLRKLEKAAGRRAVTPPSPPLRAPSRPAAPVTTLPAPAPAPAPAPRLSVEINPPGEGEQLLGRMRVDETGRPKPPQTRPAPLPGVPASEGALEEGGPAPVLPESVQAAPLDTPSGTGGAAAPVMSGSAETLLKRARDSFLARRFAMSEAAYRAFLTQHPTHPKAPQAQFELGETYYVQGRYREAGKAYLKTYQNWPRAAVSAQALLRLGMSLKKMGKKKQACETWDLLRSKFPTSRAARTSAPREMKRAKCR